MPADGSKDVAPAPLESILNTPREVHSNSIELVQQATAIPVAHCGPFHPPTKGTNKSWIFTIKDQFTRYACAYALRRATAEEVAQCCVNFIGLFGMPLVLMSDNGKQLDGHVMRELCQLLGIAKTSIVPYMPKSNGMTERDNAVIKSMLSAYVNRRADDWDRHLEAVMMAYRSSVHVTLGETPFAMMMGRRSRMPYEVVVGPPPEEEHQRQFHSEYVQTLEEAMKVAHDVVSQHVGERYDYMKKNYDRNVRAQEFQIGQPVWLQVYPRPKGQSKALLKYWDATWIVIERISAVHYRIQKSPRGRSWVMHSDRLKPHYGPITNAATKRLWLSRQPHADPVDKLRAA